MPNDMRRPAWIAHRSANLWAFSLRGVDGASGGASWSDAHSDLPRVALPDALPLTAELRAALRGRVSCRRFSETPLPLSSVATVLNTGYGVRGSASVGDVTIQERPAPSGGARYPLELFLFARRVTGLDAGIYHYDSFGHFLSRTAALSSPDGFARNIFAGQPWISKASAVIFMAAFARRTLDRYGQGGYRVILIEAGHVGQNIALACASLGLASLSIGGFPEQELAGLMLLRGGEEFPVYGVAIGRPQTADRSLVRTPEAWGTMSPDQLP